MGIAMRVKVVHLHRPLPFHRTLIRAPETQRKSCLKRTKLTGTIKSLFFRTPRPRSEVLSKPHRRPFPRVGAGTYLPYLTVVAMSPCFCFGLFCRICMARHAGTCDGRTDVYLAYRIRQECLPRSLDLGNLAAAVCRGRTHALPAFFFVLFCACEPGIGRDACFTALFGRFALGRAPFLAGRDASSGLAVLHTGNMHSDIASGDEWDNGVQWVK